MKTTMEEVRTEGAERVSLRVLTVDDARAADAPVLLFLHGKGQASLCVDELPTVCVHHAPPFQAILGRLREATVVSPQAPHAADDGWTWAPYAATLRRLLTTRFPGRRLVGTGFSRGGLGLLQLVRHAPELLSRWAIVDPQAAPAAEEAPLLSLPGTRERCWLRFGNALRHNTPFAERLAEGASPPNVRYLPALGHGELALRAYSGDRLGGPQDLYTFLQLRYEAG